MRCVVFLFAVGCGASPPAPPPAPVVAPVDAAPPDADVPDEVSAAPAWVFRYNVPPRVETWTLRHAGGRALVIVEAARGSTRYAGSVTESTELALALVAGPNKLALACKREVLPVGPPCGEAGTDVKTEVLSCYHPDFAAPMPFLAAPGVEYVTAAGCSGYRRIR
jgi:hypothetical protein